MGTWRLGGSSYAIEYIMIYKHTMRLFMLYSYSCNNLCNIHTVWTNGDHSQGQAGQVTRSQWWQCALQQGHLSSVLLEMMRTVMFASWCCYPIDYRYNISTRNPSLGSYKLTKLALELGHHLINWKKTNYSFGIENTTSSLRFRTF